MAKAFNGTNPNLNWAVNRLNGRLTNIGNQTNQNTNSGSVVATNAKVEEAVQWLINKATSQYITYNYTNDTLKNPDATSFNCVSFIVTGFYAVGVDIPGAYNAHTSREAFVACGWTWIPHDYYIYSEDCLRGDILLDEDEHMQMYIGNNQDISCGRTPASIFTHDIDDYHRGWDGILRLV